MMFLKELYRYNKKLCIAFLSFISLFIYINFKWGLTIAPILQYGMYSKIYKTNDTLNTYEIKVNNTLLDFSNYNMYQRDAIEYPVYVYYNHFNNNNEVYNSLFKRFDNTFNQSNYLNITSDFYFNNWYKQHIENILTNRIDSITYKPSCYLFNNGKFVAINNLLK